MIKSKKQMYIVVGVFVTVLALFTTTYAFFNYTRTGSANTIRTGRIAFNTTQNGTLNLTNVFPVASNSVGNDYTQDTLKISIEGDTTYGEGIEYLVTAEEVNVETTSGKKVPMTLKVAVTDDLGTEDTELNQMEYFTDRGSTTSMYKILSESVLYDGQYLLVGYIAPGQTGIDGTINIKAYLDEARVAISDTYPEGEIRKVRTTGYDNTLCEGVLTGVTESSTICATATSLQTALDNGNLTNEQVNSLKAIGLIEEYTDGTTSTWVAGRTVLTTSEWNSLQGQGNELSFKVRVEANEGIWVDPATNPNRMKNNNLDIFGDANARSNITEIYFIKETPIRMQQRYDAATVKGDLTDTTLNQGKVLAWQEGNKLYIASTGETYFPEYSTTLFAAYSNVEKIEFNNINTSSVTYMTAMFVGLSHLTNIDLGNFDTSNVIDMTSMFQGCSSLTSIDLSSIDTRSITNMSLLFKNCSNLRSVNLNGLGGSSLTSVQQMFDGCSNLQIISMNNYNFGSSNLNGFFYTSTINSILQISLKNANATNVTNMSAMFSGCSNLSSLEMSGFETSDSAINMAAMFSGCSSLTQLDLSGFNTLNVTNMSSMFSYASSLTTIYVSNTWNTNNVTSSANMFSGCSTSLVGGNGTTYDENNPADKTYAHIDGGQSNPGYLTLKNN